MASLVISLPGIDRKIYELSAETITVGQLSDNDIQINDPSVSGHHARFTLHGGTYRLADLGSANGTYVNAEPIDKADLASGIHIRFGNVDAMYSPAVQEEIQPMPDLELTARASAGDCSNAFPFKSKRKTVDKTGLLIMGFAIFSIIVFLGALALMLMIKLPQ